MTFEMLARQGRGRLPLAVAFLLSSLLILVACDPATETAEGNVDNVNAAEPSKAHNWRNDQKSLKVAMSLPAELMSFSGAKDNLEQEIQQRTEMPTSVQRVAGYDGLIQAMAADQLDVATLGAGAYASLYDLVGDKAVPLLTFRGHAGDMGYYTTIMVRADSPYQSLEDLKGKKIAYVDYNSTSGYIYPRYALRKQGVDVDDLFGEVGITGGHMQSVMALASKQYDAVITLVGGGTPETGFTSGIATLMADRGLIDLDDFRFIWYAGPIPNSTYVMNVDKDQAFIDLVRGIFAALPYEEPGVLETFGVRESTTVVAVPPEFYASIIEMRAAEIRSQTER